MAITINNNNQTSNKNLSIQISLNGLSFCILNFETNTIVYLKEITTEKRETPFKILDILIDTFETENALQTTFNNIQVIHDNELATVVPKALFNEAHLADYLKFNSKILKSDFLSYDSITTNSSVVVYVPYVNINNYIYDKFGTFSYKHVATVLIETLLKQESTSTTTNMFVNVQKTHFEIVVLDKGKLLLYNSFEFNTKEDFIYYILFTAEQLELSPDTLVLKFLGKISDTDKLYETAYKYIRHVQFSERKDNYKYLEKTQSSHAHFTLIHSL